MDKQDEENNKNEIAEKGELMEAEQNSTAEKTKKPQKLSIRRRGLPAELLNEIFKALSLENSFGLLAQMPNFLLARNVRKMINHMKMAITANKWNEQDCSPNLTISGNGFAVEHSAGQLNRWSSVRAVFPAIPKFIFNAKKSSVFLYFEMRIISCKYCWIGFSDQQFPLTNLASSKLRTDEKPGIWIEGRFHILNQVYDLQNAGDVFGVGLAKSSTNPLLLKCFSTRNGELLGSLDLPAHFFALKFFPTVSICLESNSICAIFDKEEWLYNPAQFYAMENDD